MRQRYVSGAIFAICLWLGLKMVPFIARAKMSMFCAPPSTAVKASLVTLIKSVTVTETVTTTIAPPPSVTHHTTVTALQGARGTPSKLSHVVIPMTFKEAQLSKLVRGLRHWHQSPPYVRIDGEGPKPGCRPKLIFLLSQALTAEMVARIRDIYDSLGAAIHACFEGWDILSANVPPLRDNHFDGSRGMLEALIDNTLNIPDLHYIFWMEPDTIPVRPNWLWALQRAADEGGGGEEEFWIKGSALRHHLDHQKLQGRYGRHFLYHINGNAIYNMARDQFPTFYRHTLLPYLRAKGVSRFAFDMAVEKFLQDEDNYRTWQAIAHRFRYTSTIQNRWRETVSIDEFCQIFPHTFLIHGAIPREDPPLLPS